MLYKSVETNFIINFLSKILHFTILGSVFLLNLSFELYFYSFFAMQFIVLFGVFGVVIKGMDITSLSFKFFNRANIKRYLEYSFFTLLSTVSSSVILNIDKVMIGSLAGLKENAVYVIAVTIANSLGLLFASFTRIYQPKISTVFAENKLSELSRLYNENLQLLMYFGTIVFINIIVLGKPLLEYLGPEYAGGYSVLILIALSNYLSLTVGLCGEIISLSKYYRYNLYFRLFLVVLVVVSNYIFIPIWGVFGAAFGTFLNYLIYNLLKMVFCFEKI